MNENLYKDLHGSAVVTLPLLYIGEEIQWKICKKIHHNISEIHMYAIEEGCNNLSSIFILVNYKQYKQ